MKSRLFLLLATLYVASSFGQNKKYDKLLKSFDVLSYTDTISLKTPSNFWLAVARNNERLTDLNEALDKKKSSAMEARRQLGEAMGLSHSETSRIILLNDDNMKQIIQDIYITVGIPESDVFRIFIIQDPTANAFATPDGRVFLHSGLFALENLTFEDIVGVVAHEISHFLLQHSLEGAYQIQKKLKRNDLVSGIVAAAGNASETFNSVRYDNYERKNTVRKADLQSILDEETFGKFRFKYSRGQETEADIIAFRFLDFIGVGGEHYIDVLAKLGIDEISSEESYHPSIADRIALLEYMASKRQ